mgnify:CR=1 FL=1
MLASLTLFCPVIRKVVSLLTGYDSPFLLSAESISQTNICIAVKTVYPKHIDFS